MLHRREEFLRNLCREYKVVKDTRETGRHYLLYSDSSQMGRTMQSIFPETRSQGDHTITLYQFSTGFQHWDFTHIFAFEIMDELGNLNLLNREREEENIGVILTPATVGIVLACHLQQLFYGKKPILVYAEKVDGVLRLARGFRLPPNKGILLLDDVRSTGRSFGMLEDICEEQEDAGPILASADLLNRNPGGHPTAMQTITRPHISLFYDPISSTRPENCEECKRRVPLEKDGMLVDNYGDPVLSA